MCTKSQIVYDGLKGASSNFCESVIYLLRALKLFDLFCRHISDYHTIKHL